MQWLNINHNTSEVRYETCAIFSELANLNSVLHSNRKLLKCMENHSNARNAFKPIMH